MNIYLLQVVGKWISLLVMSTISFFGLGDYQEQAIEVTNRNAMKNADIVSSPIEYTTITTYNNRLSMDTVIIKQVGKDGVLYSNWDGSEQLVMKEMVPEIVEVGTAPIDEYYGRTTGYGPDCPGCSTLGNVACLTRDGTKHSLIYNGITYTDQQFGEVRIVAAPRDKFPCGTIMKVDPGSGDSFLAIVLDTGGDMVTAWHTYSEIWIDIAFDSQQSARVGGLTSFNTKLTVKRYGW